MAVDSPPGTMIPESPSRSLRVRTSTASTPSFSRISACSRKSPCRARTPIFFDPSSGSLRVNPARSMPLPSTGREPLSFREVAHLPAHHRLAEALARLRDDLGLPEVGGGSYYSCRSLLRVAALRSEEHTSELQSRQ